jgi:uncharacterized metal-binding protein YceD (DUF177 family)
VSDKLPWTVPVATADIPESGLRVAIAADEATRAAVARHAGVRAISRLEGRFEISRLTGGRIKLDGEVSAEVGQNCVVTLEPVDADVVERVDLVFAPVREDAPAEPAAADVDAGDDMPEPLAGSAIDVGAIAVEFLILGINPYPRKPDAAFEPRHSAESPEAHPFAALAALKSGGKDRGNGGESQN